MGVRLRDDKHGRRGLVQGEQQLLGRPIPAVELCEGLDDVGGQRALEELGVFVQDRIAKRLIVLQKTKTPK